MRIFSARSSQRGWETATVARMFIYSLFKLDLHIPRASVSVRNHCYRTSFSQSAKKSRVLSVVPLAPESRPYSQPYVVTSAKGRHHAVCLCSIWRRHSKLNHLLYKLLLFIFDRYNGAHLIRECLRMEDHGFLLSTADFRG